MTFLQALYMQKKLYPARLDRRFLASLWNAGTMSAADLLVEESAAARGVDVAVGVAVVPGTQSASQGSYICESDTVVTLAVDASVTFPRVDQIIARVYDSEYSGIQDRWAVEVLKGVEASGADLTNRTGAAALPANSIRLADVLAPVGSALLTSAEISDRRQYAEQERLVSSLPRSEDAHEGQVVIFQDAAMATDGVVWKFRYNAASASAYKWEFVGGMPIYNQFTDFGSIMSASGATSWASSIASQLIPGPSGPFSLNTPSNLEGNYRVRADVMGAQFDTAGARGAVAVGDMTVGGEDVWTVAHSRVDVTTSDDSYFTGGRSVIMQDLPAAAEIALFGYTDAGGGIRLYGATIEIMPICVAAV